jgi:hypothetical protein
MTKPKQQDVIPRVKTQEKRENCMGSIKNMLYNIKQRENINSYA